MEVREGEAKKEEARDGEAWEGPLSNTFYVHNNIKINTQDDNKQIHTGRLLTLYIFIYIIYLSIIIFPHSLIMSPGLVLSLWLLFVLSYDSLLGVICLV